MSDPVFGIGYNPQKVHFEYLPQRVVRLCPDLAGEKFWLYAYSKEANAEYFVISNHRSEVSGCGVVLRGTQCIVGLPDWVLTGESRFQPHKIREPIVFTKAAIEGLVSDLLRRYSAAFGGKQKFLTVLRKEGPPIPDLLPSIRRGLEQTP